MSNTAKIAAIIPAHNEENFIISVVEKTLPFVDAVIVVDDGSSDGTWPLLQAYVTNHPQVIALHHDINLGKGASLKTAADAACYLQYDILVCLDADGQHKPENIPAFVDAIRNTKVDIVFGSRKFNADMPTMMKLGNTTLTAIINRLFSIAVSDTQSGFRAFTNEAYKQIRWESTGYEMETEMIIRTGQKELQYTEVPIETIYHDNYKGTTVLDGIKILFHIIRWKFI